MTHIIHAAGNVRLNQTWSAAKRSAVDSARSILDFSKACQQNGQFRKLEMISTVGVAVATPGLIRERLYDNPRHFRNTYEAAKAEAETLVWAALCEGLPGTIHRPSMIVGDSRTGRIRQFQVFYHLSEFLTGRKTWGVVPETNDAKLDIVSVDYVAQAIYLAHKWFINGRQYPPSVFRARKVLDIKRCYSSTSCVDVRSRAINSPIAESSALSSAMLIRSSGNSVADQETSFLQEFTVFFGLPEH